MKRMHFAASLASLRTNPSASGSLTSVKQERAARLFGQGTPVLSSGDPAPKRRPAPAHDIVAMGLQQNEENYTDTLSFVSFILSNALGQLNCSFFYEMKTIIENHSFSGSIFGHYLFFKILLCEIQVGEQLFWRSAAPNSWHFRDCPLHIFAFLANSSPCSSPPWDRMALLSGSPGAPPSKLSGQASPPSRMISSRHVLHSLTESLEAPWGWPCSWEGHRGR